MIDMGSAQGSIKLSASDFLSAIDKSIEKLNRLEQASKNTSDAVDKVGTSVTTTSGKVDDLTGKTDGLDTAQEDAADSAKDLGKEVDNLGDKEKDTSGDTEELGTKTKETNEKVKTFGDTLMGAGSKLQDYGTKISKAGTSLSKYVTAPILAAAGYAAKVTTTFESGMSTVRAISGASDDEMEQLTSKAQEMGKTTVFSATQATDALKYMAMAGWKTEEMLDGISGVMALAAASGDDLASTSDIVTDALTAFGLTAKDSAHFADVLAAASNNSNTNVSMLGESFKYCAPIAGTFGYSIEDMAIALGLMANNGIKASQAGTTLRSAFTRLAKPTKEMQGILDDMGIQLTDSTGQMKPLRELLGDLREGFSKLNAEEQAEAATILFGKTAMSGMLAVLRTSEADYNKLATAIDGAEGSATRMSEIKLDNFQGQLTLLKSNLESVGIQFGKLILPYLQKLVSGAGELVTWLGNLDDKTKSFIITAGGVLAALGPVLKIIGNVTKAVGGLSKGFGLLVNHPVVAAVALIATGILALTTYMNNNIDVVGKEYNAYQEFSDELKATADEINKLKETRQKAIENTKAEFDHYEALKTELDSIVDANGKVKSGYEDRAKFITGELSTALGIEIENNGKIIKNYQDISKEIDKTIEKRRQEAYLEAYRDSYVKALKEQKKAEENVYEAIKHRREQQEAYNAANQEYIDIQKKLAAAEKELANAPSWERSGKQNTVRLLEAQLEKANENLSQYRNQLSNANSDWRRAQDVYSEYATTIQNYEAANEALISGNEKKIKTSLDNLTSDFVSATTGTKFQLETQLKNYREHYDFLLSEVKSGTGTVTSEAVAAAKTMVDRADAELKKFNNLAKTDGINGITGFANGVSSADAQQALIGAFTALNPILGQQVSNMAANATSILHQKLNGAEEGENFVLGFIKGISALQPLLGTTITSMAGDAVKALASGLDSHSPSRKAKKYGLWFVQGFADGISENADLIQSAIDTVSDVSFTSLGQLKDIAIDMSGIDNKVPYMVPGSSSEEYNSSEISSSTSSLNNTFNFYSPQPIDEVEAANQFKQVQKQLAEGFI